jgi:hypothetical protein
MARILFLCSSLEVGKDGVGDYTRRLAQECVAQGNSVELIALHDRRVAEVTEELEVSPVGSLATLRLPANYSWEQRMAAVERRKNVFRPDWLSLQYSGYGFHPQGLAHVLSHHLKPLRHATKLHIMFHELWLGAHPTESLKERTLGKIQRRGVHQMLLALKPEAIHTSNTTYQNSLMGIGADAHILPLFGNIPLSPHNADRWLFSLINAKGFSVDWQTRSQYWLFGLFGSIQKEWNPEPLLIALREVADDYQKQIILVSIGRMGVGEAIWDRISESHSELFGFLKLGEQEPERISGVLLSLDFGVATTRYSVIEKSGTAVAMCEHGLPVIVCHKDVPDVALSTEGIFCLDSPDFREQLTQRHIHFVEEAGNGNVRVGTQSRVKARVPRSRLAVVAQRFLNDLNTKA